MTFSNDVKGQCRHVRKHLCLTLNCDVIAGQRDRICATWPVQAASGTWCRPITLLVQTSVNTLAHYKSVLWGHSPEGRVFGEWICMWHGFRFISHKCVALCFLLVWLQPLRDMHSTIFPFLWNAVCRGLRSWNNMIKNSFHTCLVPTLSVSV
jgi:hypothetical protein